MSLQSVPGLGLGVTHTQPLNSSQLRAQTSRSKQTIPSGILSEFLNHTIHEHNKIVGVGWDYILGCFVNTGTCRTASSHIFLNDNYRSVINAGLPLFLSGLAFLLPQKSFESSSIRRSKDLNPKSSFRAELLSPTLY